VYGIHNEYLCILESTGNWIRRRNLQSKPKSLGKFAEETSRTYTTAEWKKPWCCGGSPVIIKIEQVFTLPNWWLW